MHSCLRFWRTESPRGRHPAPLCGVGLAARPKAPGHVGSSTPSPSDVMLSSTGSRTFPSADVVVLRRIASAFERKCEEWAPVKAGLTGRLERSSVRELFAAVMVTDDSAIQAFSHTISGVSADLERTTQELLALYAGGEEASAAASREDGDIWRGLASSGAVPPCSRSTPGRTSSAPIATISRSSTRGRTPTGTPRFRSPSTWSIRSGSATKRRAGPGGSPSRSHASTTRRSICSSACRPQPAPRRSARRDGTPSRS